MAEATESDGTVNRADRRKLVAIVYADMVGYSRLIGMDDQGTLDRLRALRRGVIDPAVEEHGGRIVQTGGDSMLIVFDSIDGAVRCAVQVQARIPVHDGEQPSDRTIRFRIGINLGDAIADGTDLHGDAVNVAARIQAECPPGGICVTRPIRDHVQDRLNLDFAELGALSLKNISRPVQVFVVRPFDAPRERHSVDKDYLPPSTGKPSVIVMPFTNVGGEGHEAVLAEGIAKDLTTDLSRSSGITVIAPNEVSASHESWTHAHVADRPPGMCYVVQGSVRPVGHQVRINTQLIDSRSGRHVWGDRFDLGPSISTEAQNDIVGRLVRALKLALVLDGRRLIDQKDFADLQADDFIVCGRAALAQPISRETYQVALDYYERALALKPHSVDAQIGTAAVLLARIADGLSDVGEWERDQGRAEQLIMKAVSENPNNGTARMLAGFLRRLQNRLSESQVELETAVAIEPDLATAYCQLGYTILCRGDPESAIAHIERGMRIGPMEPHTPVSHSVLGICYLLLGQTDRAIECLRHACANNSRLYYAHLAMAASLALKDDLEGARAALAEATIIRPEVNSLARFRATHPWITNERHTALATPTLYVGLLRAGMPEL
jgi:class 3 adenylate cyclase/TolB-like protein/tetratricopeptide (TPR) repeat protein